MKQVLFNRLQTNLAQCISDGTIYFVKDSNGNFTQLALGDGSKSHVVGIGPKMDDATKKDLMSKLGLTISTNMGTIQLGKLANYNGVSSQKVVTYERNGLGTDVHEISTVGYVQQYMKAAQALVYAGLLNASTGEITSLNTTIIQNPSEDNLTLNSLLSGYEGESALKAGMAFVVGTKGKLSAELYPNIQVQGGETTVEVGDMIIITNVQHFETEGDIGAHNEASLIIVQNNLEIFKGGTSVSDWQNGEGVTKAKQVYAYVQQEVNKVIAQIPDLSTINNRLTQLESRATTIEGNINTINGKINTINGKINTINGEISTIKLDLAEGKYHTSWEGE